MRNNSKSRIIDILKTLPVATFALIIFFLPGTAKAATVTWDGGAGTSNWEDDNNWSNNADPTSADDVVIDTDGVTVNINASTTINSLTLGVSAGGASTTLNFNYNALSDPTGNGSLVTIAGDLNVYGSTTITHTGRSTTSVLGGVYISVGGDATIAGSINLNSKGYYSQYGPGAGRYSYNGGSGASHGGKGGDSIEITATSTYGSVTAPVLLGSGGAPAAFQSDESISFGGGAVKLYVAGTATISGSITANAGSTSASGGGSGGSIYIIAGTLAGSGSISVRGGNGNSYPDSGNGAGGRVAVYYTTDNSSLTYTLQGGSTASRYGGSGTLYKKAAADTYGDLILDNGDLEDSNNLYGKTILPDGSYTFDEIILQNKGNLVVATTTNITNTTLTWSDSGMLTDSGGGLTSLESDKSLTIPSTSKYVMDIATSSTSTLRTLANMTVSGTLTHSSNITATSGQLSVYKLAINITNDFEITGTGSINVTSRGYYGNTGPGAGNGGWDNPAGASYGGKGGDGASYLAGDVYGSVTDPYHLGSGGGDGRWGEKGGYGGGIVKIIVGGTATTSGTIIANGGDGTGSDAGGSGGTVYISAGILKGDGSISVKGGQAGWGGTGNGGGGRIAVYYTTDSSSLTYNLYGGNTNSAYYGGAGTLYKKPSGDTYGDLIIDNNDIVDTTNYYGKTPIYGTYTFDEVILRNKGNLLATTTTSITNTTLTWTDDGILTDGGGSMTSINDNQNLTIPSGAKYFSEIATSTTNAIRSFNNVTVNGTLTHSLNKNATASTQSLYKLIWSISGDLTVGAGGMIDASERGYDVNQGIGAGIYGSGGGSGGSYGGKGGNGADAVASTTYGSVTQPIHLGSAGGSAYWNSAAGKGGGSIILNVTGETDVSGSIKADGGNTTGESGGGSGGSIYLTTGTLTGNGTISAKGGSVGNASGGNGGGGRIAIYYTSDTSTITYTYQGGSTASRYGGSGTLFKKSTMQTYGDLYLNNNDIGGTTISLLGKTPIEDSISVNNFTAQNSAYLDTKNAPVIHYIYGNISFTNSAASSTSTLEMSGNTDATISQSGPLGMGALVINKTNATSTLLTNFLASSTLAVTSGAFDANGKAATTTATTTINEGNYFASSSLQSFGGLSISSGNFFAGNYIIDINGHFEQSGGTFWAPATTTLSGNFDRTVESGFTHNSGTLVLDGSNQRMTGTTTLYKLTKSATAASTLTFGANQTQTVVNAMTLNGALGNLLSLRSTVTDTQWKIDPQGTRTISYLDVKDSNNINATIIMANGTNSTDSGNNTNWYFYPLLTQKDYRFFQNTDAVQPGTSLGTLSATTTLTSTSSPVRLRLNFTTTGSVPANTALFDLQVATSSFEWLNVSPAYFGANSDWWDQSWTKRKVIYVGNSSSSALADFQVNLIVNYDGDMQSDFDDLRFTDTSNNTLSYWTEAVSASASSSVWIKVGSLPANSTSTIYMYYGNPAASSGSNINNTFIFGDEFSGSEIDTNKWTLTDSTGFSVTGGELKGTNTTGRLTSISTFSDGVVLEIKERYVTMASNGFMSGGFFLSIFNNFGYLHHPSNDYYRRDGDWFAISASAPSVTNLKTKISVKSSSLVDLSVTNYYSRVSYQSISNISSVVANEPIVLGKRYDDLLTGQAYEAYWDSIIIRKYAVVDPYATTTSVAEESAPSTLWSYKDNVSVASSTAISATLLDGSDINGYYIEKNPTGANESEYASGQEVEYDFVVHPVFASLDVYYYFRLVQSDGTALSGYTNYPVIYFHVTQGGGGGGSGPVYSGFIENVEGGDGGGTPQDGGTDEGGDTDNTEGGDGGGVGQGGGSSQGGGTEGAP
jgi:hypothetical protein